VVQLGRLDRLGPLAWRTLGLFALNMALATALGLLLMNVVHPGAHVGGEARAQLIAEHGVQARSLQATAAGLQGLSLNVLVAVFLPRNLLKDVVEFQLLPLILFALLVGAAGTQLPERQRQHLHAGLDIVGGLMTRIVHYALALAPYAVPALIFSVVFKFGGGVLRALATFVVVVLVGLAVHLFGTLSLLLKLFSRRSPRAFFRSVRTILITAFSTSSSNATLPTSLAVTREQLGVSEATAGLVLPLGATMNMSGTALYEGCVVLFVAQVYGIPLEWAQQLTLVLLAVLSAVAVAGIPGGSLPLIVGLLTTFGIPAEGIAIILGTDRILDMARTVLNVAADVATACIVDERVGPRKEPEAAL
jgi:DAACS family dicarboxylate/amino acid:cation (Na+ or H+) symporter